MRGICPGNKKVQPTGWMILYHLSDLRLRSGSGTDPPVVAITRGIRLHLLDIRPPGRGTALRRRTERAVTCAVLLRRPQRLPITSQSSRRAHSAEAILRTPSARMSGEVARFIRTNPAPPGPKAIPELTAIRPRSRKTAAGSLPRPSFRQSSQAR